VPVKLRNTNPDVVLSADQLFGGRHYVITEIGGISGWHVGEIVYRALGVHPSRIDNLQTGTYIDISECKHRFRELRKGEIIEITAS
jgi:hypothetical protein